MLFSFKRRKKRKRQKATSNRRVFLKPSPKVVHWKEKKAQKNVSHETKKEYYEYKIKRDYFQRIEKDVRKREDVQGIRGYSSVVPLNRDIVSHDCEPCRLRKARRRSLFSHGYAGKGKAIYGRRVHTEDSKRNCGGC